MAKLNSEIKMTIHCAKQTAYKVVETDSLSVLETFVNKFLEDGWLTTGGVATGVVDDQAYYAQALIKEEIVSRRETDEELDMRTAGET